MGAKSRWSLETEGGLRIPIGPRGVVVGRGAACDVVINHEQVRG